MGEEMAEMLIPGGWIIETEWDDNYNLDSNVTPIDLLEQNIAAHPDTDTFSVIMYTGAFAPLHEGHYKVMEKAKELIESTGEIVAGGYFAPDNDEYVSRKLGNEIYAAPVRTRMARELVDGTSDWMMVDPWMAETCPVALNFSTVLMRTEDYLAVKFPHLKFKVYFVFGGDNVQFAAAFNWYGQAVLINRGDDVSWIKDKEWYNPERILICDIPVSDISSTKVRKQYEEATLVSA